MDKKKINVFCCEPTFYMRVPGSCLEVGKVYTCYWLYDEIWSRFLVKSISLLKGDRAKVYVDYLDNRENYLYEYEPPFFFLRSDGAISKPIRQIFEEEMYEKEYLPKKAYYDEEARQVRKEEEERERRFRENFKKNMITKEKFARTLTPEKKEILVKYFNTLYPCRELGPRELAITYMAWLRSSGKLLFSESISIIEFGVQFNEEELRISFEDPSREGKIDLEFTAKYYGLVNVWNIIKDREYAAEELDDEGFPRHDTGM